MVLSTNWCNMIVLLLPDENIANWLRNLNRKRKINPIQDANNNWIITLYELNHPLFSDLYKQLNTYPKIEYKPKI